MTARWWLLCTALGVSSAVAQQRFDSPEAAAQAVIEAAGKHDTARLTLIFGPQAQGVLTSGSANQDRNEQSEFAHLAQASHRIEISPINPNRAILAVGDEDWPFPVPLLRTQGEWSFESSVAPAEMRARRIGADELDAIDVCQGYVAAQQKYAAEDRGHDGMLQYAPRLVSAPGRQNGLYWTGETAPLIPKGLAAAAWGDNPQPRPYHGYFFRVLDGQGDAAPGGAHNYLVHGKLIGGFALLAWPAEYGETGIHTFIVNQDGEVYQKDIQPVPGKLTPAVTRYDPDHSWAPVD